MVKVSDEQIEQLAKVMQDAETKSKVDLPKMIGGGESLEFYRGMVTGLLMSYEMLMAHGGENKTMAQWLSLATARACEQHLNLKHSDDLAFPEMIEIG